MLVEGVACGVSGAANSIQTLNVSSSFLEVHATSAAVSRFNGGVTADYGRIAQPRYFAYDSYGTLCGSDLSPALDALIGKYLIIDFDANGHGEAPPYQALRPGQTATRPDDLAESGWVFGGWYSDAACTELYDFSASVTEDLILDAMWEKYIIVYDVWIGETRVTSDNAADILGDGTASYDPQTRTLTLTGAVLSQASGDHGYIIKSKGDLTVRGSAAIENSTDLCAGIVADGDLTLDGSFTISTVGICVDAFYGTLTATNGSTLTATTHPSLSTYSGEAINGRVVVIEGGSTVTAKTTAYQNAAIHARQGLSITGGSVVDLESAAYNAVYAEADLTIVDSTLTARGSAVSDYYGAIDLGQGTLQLSGVAIVMPVGGTVGVGWQGGTVLEPDGETGARTVRIEPLVEYDLWLGETRVSNANRHDILSDGTASFDPATGTLTLNSLTGVTGRHSNALIYSRIDLTLELVGSSTLTDTATVQSTGYYVFDADGHSLTVTGDGSLSIALNISTKSDGGHALRCGSLLMDGGSLALSAVKGISGNNYWVGGLKTESLTVLGGRLLSTGDSLFAALRRRPCRGGEPYAQGREERRRDERQLPHGGRVPGRQYRQLSVSLSADRAGPRVRRLAGRDPGDRAEHARRPGRRHCELRPQRGYPDLHRQRPRHHGRP